MHPAITDKGEDIWLYVKVIPGAKIAKIGGVWCDQNNRQHLMIKVQQPPDNGKANKAVVQMLAKAIKHPKSRIHVERGAIARIKTLRIERIDAICQNKLKRLLEEPNI